MKIFQSFWFFLNKKSKISFFIIIFFSIIQAILEMIGIAAAIPFVTFLLNPESLSEITFIKNFINVENIEINNQMTMIFCLIFFSIFLIKNIIIILTNKIIFKFIFNFRTKLFNNLLEKILHQEFLFFVKKGLTKIFNTTFNEVNIFSVNVVRPMIILISELLISFAILFLIIMTGNADILILILPIMILVGFVLKIINKHIKDWSNIRIQNNEKIVNSNLNLVSGIKEILIFGKVSNILNQFSNSLKSLEYVDRKNNLVTTYPKILLEQSVILIFILIIFFLSFYNVATDEIIVILSFYLTAAYRLVPSINKIFVSIQQLKFGKPSILKIMDFYSLEKKNKFLEHDKFNETLNFNKEILLKSFKFGYSASNQIFNNLNLKIKKNEIIGISGQSGSGKSTIINLLTTLIKPDSGKLLIDQNIIETSEDYRKYQNLFSISSQDTYLLDASIKENIIFDFNTKINEDRLHKAINFANLSKMISDLPKGLDTQVGSTLKQLSSGQKQRIAIARLLYSNREILVFDEATNALDEKNEKEIFKKLNKLRKDKTIIIISHNQENLKICDRVYKIENKEIFEVKL